MVIQTALSRYFECSLEVDIINNPQLIVHISKLGKEKKSTTNDYLENMLLCTLVAFSILSYPCIEMLQSVTAAILVLCLNLKEAASNTYGFKADQQDGLKSGLIGMVQGTIYPCPYFQLIHVNICAIVNCADNTRGSCNANQHIRLWHNFICKENLSLSVITCSSGSCRRCLLLTCTIYVNGHLCLTRQRMAATRTY